MSQQIIAKKTVLEREERENSDTWFCPKCSYENLKLLPTCEICETIKPKDEQQLLKIQDRATDGFECHNCSHVSKVLNPKCKSCGEILIPEDSQEEQEEAEAETTVKKTVPQLKECPHCKFENDPDNEECVACQQNMNEIGQFRTKSLAHKKKNNRYQEQKCRYCLMILKKAFVTNHERICPGRANSIEGYEHIKRFYCTFCYEKFDYKMAKSHDQKCEERSKFLSKVDNPTFERCSQLQINTMIYMHEKSEKLHWKAEQALTARVESLGYEASDLENLHHYIVNYAPIIIHMHANNHMQFFVKDTHYRNQFETKKSSGSLSETSRIAWEDRMFDSKHHTASPFQRVKYGTINFTNDPKGVGVCSSYGQSYFLLKPHVRNRCTVTDMDSSSPSATIGTFQFSYHVLNKITDPQITAAFEGSKGKEVRSDVVGTYKEIQIHGPVQFSKDIQRVYISRMELGDPATEEMVKQFCKNNDLQYEIFGEIAPEGGGMFPHPFGLHPPIRPFIKGFGKIKKAPRKSKKSTAPVKKAPKKRARKVPHQSQFQEDYY